MVLRAKSRDQRTSTALTSSASQRVIRDDGMDAQKQEFLRERLIHHIRGRTCGGSGCEVQISTFKNQFQFAVGSVIA
jgi:hypothetical protein